MIGATDMIDGPSLLVLATQTVGVVAYVRQHFGRVDGPWVFPVCLAASLGVCFAAHVDAALDLRFAQRVVAVSALAFGVMVLRRGGNAAATTSGHGPSDQGGPTPPFHHITENSPVTSFLMHLIPIVLLGSILFPMVLHMIR